jgi:hypothetical protein
VISVVVTGGGDDQQPHAEVVSCRYVHQRRRGRLDEREHKMGPVVWLLVAAVYLMLFVTLALTTLHKGHFILFWVGIIFPVLWIIGAIMAPSRRAEARGVA